MSLQDAGTRPPTTTRVTTPGGGRRPWPGWARSLAGALVVLLLCELGARIVGPVLPVAGYEEATADHLTLLDRRDEPLDTLLAGASEIGAGVDPGQLTTTSAEVDGAHTMWQAGAGMQTVARTLTDVILPRHRPERLVIGVSSRHFNRNNNADFLDRVVRESFGYQVDTGTLGLLGQVEHQVGRVSALVRFRHELSSPARYLRYRRGGYLDANGMALSRLEIDTYEPNETHLAQERLAFADYEVDEQDLASLRHLIDQATAEGIDVVLMQMPVYERHFRALVPGLEAGDRQAQQAMRDVAADAGAAYLDPRADLDWDHPDWWADTNHLNGRGAQRLTDWLAGELDQLP